MDGSNQKRYTSSCKFLVPHNNIYLSTLYVLNYDRICWRNITSALYYGSGTLLVHYKVAGSLLLQICSRLRYWFLILLTVILNILVLASYVAPTTMENSTNSGSSGSSIPTIPKLSDAYIITFYVLGAIHTFFALWMIVEYFVVNGTHFVLPQFLCEIPLPSMPRWLRHRGIDWPDKWEKLVSL